MAKVQAHIKVFIGSPSDCDEERRAARDAAKLVNRAVGKSKGCYLEPIGWEDEPPRAGRPQEIINHQVDECDWALFFLNQRWGTPTGLYSSGFYEEFCRARDRQREQGFPHIALFFRTLDPSVLLEPNEQLQSNLAFRDEIHASREFLTKSYESAQELAVLLPEYLSQWLLADEFLVEDAPTDREIELQNQLLRLQEELKERSAPNTESLSSAVRLLREGQPAQAEARLRFEIKADNQDPDAFHALAMSLYSQGRLEDSLAASARSLELRPNDALALAHYGLVLEGLARHEDAIVAFDRALALNPDDAAVLNNKGVALGVIGRGEEALECFNRALRLRHALPGTLSNKGTTLSNLGRFEEAIEVLGESLRLLPDNVTTMLALANALSEVGRNEEALATVEQVLALHSSSVRALRLHSMIQGRLGSPDKALESAQRALLLRPEDPDSLWLTAVSYADLGQLKKALAAFDRFLEIDPDSTDALVARGNALVEMGEAREAVKAYSRAADLAPDDPDVLSALGYGLSRAGKTAEAVAWFRRSLELRPDDVQALSWLGSTLGAAGDRSGAIETFDLALKIEPNSGAVLSNRGVIYFDSGDMAHARTDITRAAEVMANSSSWLNLCCLEIVARDVEAAAAALNRATDATIQDEHPGVVLWFRAVVTGLRGNSDLAFALLREAASAVHGDRRTIRNLSDMNETIWDLLPRTLATQVVSTAQVLAGSQAPHDRRR